MTDTDAAALLMLLPTERSHSRHRPDTIDRILVAVAVELGAPIPEAAAEALRSNTRHRFYRRPESHNAAEIQALHARSVLTKHGLI